MNRTGAQMVTAPQNKAPNRQRSTTNQQEEMVDGKSEDPSRQIRSRPQTLLRRQTRRDLTPYGTPQNSYPRRPDSLPIKDGPAPRLPEMCPPYFLSPLFGSPMDVCFLAFVSGPMSL